MSAWTKFCAAVFGLCLVTGSAQADLILDDNIILVIDLTGPQPINYTINFNPAPGTPDLSDGAGIGGNGAFPVIVDVPSADRILLLIQNNAGFQVNNIAGSLTFSDLDWAGAAGMITNVEVIGEVKILSDGGGVFAYDWVDQMDISFDTHSFTVPLVSPAPPGVFFDDGDRLGVEIQLTFEQIPQPGTLALFSLGLAGLGFARRRKVA